MFGVIGILPWEERLEYCCLAMVYPLSAPGAKVLPDSRNVNTESNLQGVSSAAQGLEMDSSVVSVEVPSPNNACLLSRRHQSEGSESSVLDDLDRNRLVQPLEVYFPPSKRTRFEGQIIGQGLHPSAETPSLLFLDQHLSSAPQSANTESSSVSGSQGTSAASLVVGTCSNLHDVSAAP